MKTMDTNRLALAYTSRIWQSRDSNLKSDMSVHVLCVKQAKHRTKRILRVRVNEGQALGMESQIISTF